MGLLTTFANKFMPLSEDVLNEIRALRAGFEKIQATNQDIHAAQSLHKMISLLDEFLSTGFSSNSNNLVAIDEIEYTFAPLIFNETTQAAGALLLTSLKRICNMSLEDIFAPNPIARLSTSLITLWSGDNDPKKELVRYTELLESRIKLYKKIQEKQPGQYQAFGINDIQFISPKENIESKAYLDLVEKIKKHLNHYVPYDAQQNKDYELRKEFFLNSIQTYKSSETFVTLLDEMFKNLYGTESIYRGHLAIGTILNNIMTDTIDVMSTDGPKFILVPAKEIQLPIHQNQLDNILVDTDFCKDPSIYFDNTSIDIISALLAESLITDYETLLDYIKNISVNKTSMQMHLIKCINNFIADKDVENYKKSLRNIHMTSEPILISTLMERLIHHIAFITGSENLNEHLRETNIIQYVFYTLYNWIIDVFYTPPEIVENNNTCEIKIAHQILTEIEEADNLIEKTIVQNNASDFFENIQKADTAREKLGQPSYIDSINIQEKCVAIAQLASQAFYYEVKKLHNTQITEILQARLKDLLEVTNKIRSYAGFKTETPGLSLLNKMLSPKNAEQEPTPVKKEAEPFLSSTMLPYVGQIYGYVATSLQSLSSLPRACVTSIWSASTTILDQGASAVVSSIIKMPRCD